MAPAEPMLDATTDVVFMGELSEISFSTENIWRVSARWREEATHVLVASVRKDNDGEAAEGGDQTTPADYANVAAVFHGVAHDEMRQHQNHQVADGDESNDARVL